MISRFALRVTLVACLGGLGTPSMAEDAAKPQPPAAQAAPAAAVKLDAVPEKDAAPDPLTPPDQEGPPPPAPDAPAEKPAEVVPPAVPEPDPIVTQILARLSNAGGRAENREDASGLAAYYNGVKGQPIWVSKEGFTSNASKVIREIRAADEWGLDASAFQLPAAPQAGAKPEALADAELKLSAAILKYARYARGGRLDPPSLSEVIDRRPHIYDPKSVLRAMAAADSPDAYLRGLHPKNEQFKRLRQALLSLSKGVSSGSAFRISAGPVLRPGSSDPQIAIIRKRLGAGMDGKRDTVYDNALLQAVKRYQRDNGLPANGIIDQSFRAALNETARRPLPASGPMDERRLRILVNMERWRWMPDDLGSFYVWDSIPEQLTRVFDHGRVVLQERIVVGKPVTPTPTFTANMQFVTFNPEWAVPEGIKVNEIAPKLQQAGGGGGFYGGYGGGGGARQALERMGGLRVIYNGREIDPDTVDWGSVDIRRFQFIQGPGERNVLGVVKFRFPNKHDVYMHDTPDRHMFNQAPRTFSHGCMRTENPLHLADVILGHDKGISPEQIRGMVQSGATNEIKLNTPVPVHIVYFTAEADDQGQVHFLPDVYGIDSRIASALRGQAVHFAQGPVVTADNQDRRQAQRYDPYQRNNPYQRGAPYPQQQQPYGAPYPGWGSPYQYQRYGDPRYAPRGPWNPFQDWQ